VGAESVGQDGEGEGEAGSGPELAFHRQGAILGLAQLLGDGEPKTGTARLAAVGGVNLVEGLKNGGQLVGSDAGTFVADRERGVSIGAEDPQRHLTSGGRELQGVPEKIDKNLDEPLAVTHDRWQLDLLYRSVREMPALAAGLIRGAADLYHEHVAIDIETVDDGYLFRLRFWPADDDRS